MKCRMFALSLALGALLCLAPSVAALEPQPEVPAPDTAAASQTDTPAAPAEEAAPDAAEPAGQALTEEVTVTVEVPILPEKPPIQISYTTPEEIGFTWEEDGLELEVAEVLPVEEISLAPDPDASAPEAPADSDDTNGTEAAAASDAPADSDDTNGTKAAAASDAPAQAPHTEASAAAQPAAPAVPTLPQTGTTGWAAAALAAFGTGLLAAGQCLTCKAKRS